MAIADLSVYNEFAYTTLTEVLAQQVDVFNEASGNALALSSGAHIGDFSDQIKFGLVSGLVRRRNMYASGALSSVDMRQIVDTKVKVAAGTPPIELSPSQFNWIGINQEEAGAAMGIQLAKDTLADMVNTAIGAAVAAISNVSTNVLNVTAQAAVSGGPFNGMQTQTMSFQNQNAASALLGDSAGNLTAWVMHSKCWHDLFGQQLNNVERLFTYGNVGVVRDPAGRLYVMTDCPSLYNATGGPSSTPEYLTLGLVPGAVTVEHNGDFVDNWQTINGNENIVRTYQAEWSYELGIKGFSWGKGSKSPTSAALFTAANWTQYATNYKDLGGVLLITK